MKFLYIVTVISIVKAFGGELPVNNFPQDCPQATRLASTFRGHVTEFTHTVSLLVNSRVEVVELTRNGLVFSPEGTLKPSEVRALEEFMKRFEIERMAVGENQVTLIPWLYWIDRTLGWHISWTYVFARTQEGFTAGEIVCDVDKEPVTREKVSQRLDRTWFLLRRTQPIDGGYVLPYDPHSQKRGSK